MRKTILSILAVMLMSVLPSFSAIQYCLSPEGFETGVIPAGWTQENVNGTALWTVEGGVNANLGLPKGAKSGDYRAVLRGTSGQVEGFVTKLITPAMNLTQAYNPQLVFSHAQVARFGFFDTLRVYYRVNATAPWQSLVEYTSPVTTWKTETILLPGYQQGTAYQLAFEASDHAGLGVVLDDISVYPATQCQDASIQNIAVTSTTATISLVCNGSYNNFEVVVSENLINDLTAFDPDSVVFYSITEDYDVIVDSLESYQTYYVYVRTDCDDNIPGYTNWVRGTFKTSRLVDLPYVETFETTEPIGNNLNFGSPVGWICGGLKGVNMPAVYKGSSTSDKNNCSVDSTNYLAFGGALSTTVVPVGADSVQYAVSPEINGNLANCELDFWGTVYNYYYNGLTQYAAELSVGIMTDPNDLGTLEVIETVKIDNALQFKHFHVSFAGYTGAGKHIALVSQSNKENVFFVDNFSVKEVNISVPCNIRATEVLPTGFTVTPQLHGADSWNLKVATEYTRDPASLADSLCLVNQTGLTTVNYLVQLPETEIAGKIVLIYVQAVKNGVTSEWSFPLTLRVPTSTVVPLNLTFNAGSFETLALKDLVNERHANNTTNSPAVFTSPLKSFGMYPTTSAVAPLHDGAYLLLNGIDNFIALPYINDLTGLEVTFRLSAGSESFAGSSRVAVGVMTDPYDLSTFTEIARYDGPTGSYQKVRVDLAAYTGTGHYVALRALAPVTPNANYGSRNCIDNLIVQPLSTCFDAENINATAEARTAVIRWTPGGMTGFLVKVYTDEDRTELDTMIVKTTAAAATADSVVLTNLTPYTYYYYTVQTICGTDTLITEDAYSFMTKLGVPFKETFEGLVGSAVLPMGWDNTEGTASSTYAFQRYDYSGNPNKCLRFNSYSAPAGADNYLATPSIMLDGADAMRLSFDYKNPAGGDFEVLYALDGDTNRTQIFANLTNQYDYVTKNFDLTPFIGHSIVIYFHATSNWGNGDAYVYLDNVGIKAIDPNCIGMGTLTATNVGETEADITWTVGGVQEAYLKVTEMGDTTALFEGVVTSSPHHLSGLTQNTFYEVLGYQPCGTQDTLITYFKTNCAPISVEDFATETFSDELNFECWRSGVSDTSGVGSTYIFEPSVSYINGLGNVLQLEKRQNSADNVYGNGYYAILPALTIDSISKYQVVFNAATSRGDTANLHSLQVGVITNPEDFSTFELIKEINLSYAADSLHMKQYAVSFADYLGDLYNDYGTNVTFRVSADAYHSNVAYIDNVRLMEATSCPQILDMEQTAQSCTSVTLTWSGTASLYDVILTEDLCNPDTVVNPAYSQTGLTDTTVSFTNLPAGVTYFAFVRGICANGDTSNWSSYTLASTSYGTPFLETFDQMTPYPQDEWKVFTVSINAGEDFNTTGFVPNTSSYKMSIQNVDSRLTNMAGKAARTEVYASSYNGFLQSPIIDLSNVDSGMGVNLSFRIGMVAYSSSTELSTNFSGRSFRVYVSEDGENFKATDVTEWNCDGTGDYEYVSLGTSDAEKVNVDLSKYAGKNISLGFYSGSSVSQPDAYLYIDSVAIAAYDNSCLPVSRIRTNVEANSASVTWNNNTPGVSVIVELSDNSNFSTILKHDSLVGDSVHYSELGYFTTYYVRIKPACADEWVTTKFTTKYGVPYTETFNASNSYLPAGWERLEGDLLAGTTTASTYAWSLTTTPGGGLTDNHVYCYTNTQSSYSTGLLTPRLLSLVSPDVYLLQQTGYDLILSYDMAMTTSASGTASPERARVKGHSFNLCIMATGDTAWTVLQSWKDTAMLEIPAIAEQQTVDLSAYAGQTVRLAFFASSDTTSTSSSVYHHIDNIRLRHVNPNCATPVAHVVSTAQTTATVGWDAETGAQYVVEISKIESFASIIDSVTTTDSTATFSGLESADEYYARVKKICSAGNESGWSEPVKVRTKCESITEYPWTEDFSAYPSGTLTDPCMINEHLAGSGTRVFEVTTSSMGGNNSKKLMLPDMSSGTMTLLSLPLMAFDSTYLYELSFSVYRSASYSSYTDEGVRIYLGENPAIDATAQEIVFVPREPNVEVPGLIPAESGSGWYTYNFTFRASGEKNFILRGESKYGASTYLDDFVVSAFTNTQTIRNAEFGGATRNTMSLSWTLVDNSICQDAEVVISTTELDSAQLEAADKIQVSNATEYTFSGLVRETTYYMYVRTICDGVYGGWASASGTTTGLVNDIQAAVGNGSASATLIVTSYGNTYSQHIYTAQELSAAGVAAGPIQSVAFDYTGASSNYDKTQTIYIGTTTQTEYTGAESTDFIPNLQIVNGPTLRSYVPGWVTYTFNQPFIWDGSSNIVVGVLTNGDGTHMGSSGWSTNGTNVTANRTIYRYKDAAIIDVTNLSAVNNGSASSIRPNAKFGQQFTLEACPAVDTIVASYIGRGTSEILVSWTASEGDYVADYDVFITDQADVDLATITPQYTVDSLSLPITGLTDGTQYYIYVRANCDADGHDDGISQWAMTTITTNLSCMPVKDMAVTFLNTNHVRATWNKYTEEQETDFRYVLSPVELDSAALAQATLLSCTTMYLDLDELNHETTYYLYVRGECAERISSWNSISFTTPQSCQPVVDIVVDRTSANAARISWSHAPFAFEQLWEVGIVGQPATKQFVADTMAVFAGLMGNTEYTAYVRAVCAEGDTSIVNTVSFTTSAVAALECIPSGTDEPSTYDDSYNYSPFGHYYGNSWNQMIYPATLVGQEGTINRMSFYCKDGATFTQQSVTVYMANVENAAAQSATDWVPMSDLVQVFHADNYVHPTAEGWSEIVLDTQFEYAGGNLAVIVACLNDGYDSDLTYSYSVEQNGALMYRRADGDPSYGQHPGTNGGTRSTNLPLAQFCFVMSGCQKVSDLKATNVTMESAVLSWYPGGSETSWNTILSSTPLSEAQLAAAQTTTLTTASQTLTDLHVGRDYFYYVAPVCGSTSGPWVSCHFVTEATCQQPVNVVVDSIEIHEADVFFNYGESGPAASYDVIYGPAATFSVFDPATYQLIHVTDTTAHLSGLTADTYYNVAVRAICNEADTGRFSEPVLFLTNCDIVTAFPWSDDFESYAVGEFFNQCWVNEHTATESPSSTYSNYLFMVTSQSLGGVASKVLELRDQQAGNVTQLTLPRMYFAEGQPLEFSIDVYRSHNSTIKSNEGLRIYISTSDTVDASAQLLAFIPRQYSVDGINANAVDTARWCTYHFQLPEIGEGNIIIEGISEYGLATYFDNVSVTSLDLTCGGVNAISVSDLDVTSAVLNWTTIGNDSVRVVVTDELGGNILTRVTTAKSVNITGLTKGTHYQATVTQLCSGRSQMILFATYESVPYFEDATLPKDWTVAYGDGASYYYWHTTKSSDYILGEMKDTVFYCNLYYYYPVQTRLMSPEILVPELGDNELLYLDWLMGATAASAYYGGTELDPSTVIRVDICTYDSTGEGTWNAVKTWEGSNLGQIPWDNSGKFTVDLSDYAGQNIRFGFYASKDDYSSVSAYLSIDNIYLHRVQEMSYDANACSWVDYMDEYFSIPLDSFVLGTTEYQTMVTGIEENPDTLVTMNLTVSEATQTILHDTICEGELYDRNDINPFIARTSVIKPHFYTSVNGCDSLVSIHIEVKPSSRRDTTILSCKDQPVTVNGKTYYNNIVVIDTLSGVNTCDSIVRTFIQFSETAGYDINQHRILCAGDTYTDAAFPNGISAAGTYTATVKTAYGCDSTVTVKMLVANNGAAYDTITIEELPYVYAEDTILGTNVGAGDYEFPLQATCGQVTLYIHVTDGKGEGQAVDNLKVLQLSVAPNPASVGEPIEILSQVSMVPDFSLMVFDAIGQLVYATDEPSLTIPGLPVAGYYTVRLTSDGQSFQAKLLVK